MRISSYPLRFAPLLLPLTAACAGIIGLTGHLGSVSSGNVEFVLVVFIFSGFLPACALIGSGLLLADMKLPDFRPMLLAALAALMLVGGWMGYNWGQALNF